MDKNAYQNELDMVRFTAAGRAALTEQLMQPQAQPRQRIRPRIAVAAALAAVLLIGSVAAAAGPLWERYFGQLDESQQAIIDTLSKQLPPDECNGTVMTPLAAFGDEDFYYLMLEIRAPEGTILPNYSKDEGYYQLFNDEGEDMTLTDANGQNIRGNLEFEWMPRTGEDNVLTAVIRLWPSEKADYSDGTDKILRLPGLWVQLPDKEYVPVFTGKWEFNIGAHTGGIQRHTLDVSNVTIEDELCGTMTLETLQISPLGMRWRYHWETAQEGIWPGAEIAVVMADGSELYLSSIMGSCDEAEQWNESYGPFEAPIDLDQAAAIRWGDAEIPLN